MLVVSNRRPSFPVKVVPGIAWTGAPIIKPPAVMMAASKVLFSLLSVMIDPLLGNRTLWCGRTRIATDIGDLATIFVEA
jgi:hypothetical protein